MPLRGRKLYCIVDPAGVQVDGILAFNELDALRLFHNEALGEGAAAVRDGGLVFRSPLDQEVCAGRWKVCRQALNGASGAPVEVVVPEPDWPKPEWA
jgi:hypothetical protein